MRITLFFVFSCFILFCSNAMAAEAPPDNIVLSKTQTEKLAQVIKANNSYCRVGPHDKWVCLELAKTIPSGLRDEIIKVFSKQLIIYLDRKNIPPEEKVFQRKISEFEFVGYKDGCLLSVGIGWEEKNKIGVSYHYYRGQFSGCEFSIIYSWDGADWIKSGEGSIVSLY